MDEYRSGYKEKDWDRERDRDREREKERERSKDREKHKHKHHDRSRSRSKSRERSKDRSSSKDRERRERKGYDRDSESKEERRARKEREKAEKKRRESGGDDTSTSRGFESYPDTSAYQPATYQAPQYPTGGSYEHQSTTSSEHPYTSGYNTSEYPSYPSQPTYGASEGYGGSSDSYPPPRPPKSPHDPGTYGGDQSTHRAYDQSHSGTYDQSHSQTYGSSTYSAPAPSPGHYGPSPAPGDSYGQYDQHTSHSSSTYPSHQESSPAYGASHTGSSYPSHQESSSTYGTSSHTGGYGDYSGDQSSYNTGGQTYGPAPAPAAVPYGSGSSDTYTHGSGYDQGVSSHQQYPSDSSFEPQMPGAMPSEHEYGGSSTYGSGAAPSTSETRYGSGYDHSSTSYSTTAAAATGVAAASGGAFVQSPDMSTYSHPAPRNPIGSNYNPRPEPSGYPPRGKVPTMEFSHPETLDASGGGKAHGKAPEATKQAKGFLSSFPAALQSSLGEIAKSLTNPSGTGSHFHTHTGSQCTHPDHARSAHRFNSFAAVRRGNLAKWYVDGKDYMYAVSCALERARKSIWILDWWLSPELYLRRPCAAHEQYRIDRMLQAAALRGVKVNIIVYKEVTQALTLSSAHTKHALEALHPNIAVFRHPDHLPDRISISEAVTNAVTSGSMNLASIGDALSGDNVVLYWAHHEKLCLIDGEIEGGGIAFMGGLDLCFGRWDTNEHRISDVHPEDVSQTVFVGQDYNNSRVMDFHTVDQYLQNKLDRTKYSRMGWSDIALCLTGPSVEDLKSLFVDRWNYIYKDKYAVRKDSRFQPLTLTEVSGDTGGFEGGAFTGASYDLNIKGTFSRLKGRLSRGSRSAPSEEKQRRKDRDMDALAFGGDSDEEEDDRRRRDSPPRTRGESSPRERERERERDRYEEEPRSRGEERPRSRGLFSGYADYNKYEDQSLGIQCQIIRSCSPWSNDTPTEHSIANAYYDIISSAQHFIYIENQFFITNTGTEGGIVKNKIGEAIVNRIIKAHSQREKFRIIVIMPSVPAFAGDLQNKEALGTRAIMEFQYDSICRGGKGTSILERLSAKGINGSDYIRFYNLRNYDRINASSDLSQVKKTAGVSYESAQADLDNRIGAGWDSDRTRGGEYNKWQQAAHGQSRSDVWDSVASCAMLGGGDIRDVPWSGSPEDEIDAFVTEELYVHSKCLIADDRVVICGSANLNDRSQLGDHDSEIAIVIEDPTPLASRMNNREYVASHFAGTLRRHLFRKHLGLIPAQDLKVVDDNMIPVPAPNIYDFDSQEDKMVMDPLSDDFWNLWNGTAKVNYDCFSRVFRSVPYGPIHNWKEYTEYYGKYFQPGGTKEKPIPAKYEVGHVVKEDFPSGVEGVRAVKEVLSKIRGHLVEMPLDFLKDEDIAQESAEFNLITYSIYT